MKGCGVVSLAVLAASLSPAFSQMRRDIRAADHYYLSGGEREIALHFLPSRPVPDPALEGGGASTSSAAAKPVSCSKRTTARRSVGKRREMSAKARSLAEGRSWEAVLDGLLGSTIGSPVSRRGDAGQRPAPGTSLACWRPARGENGRPWERMRCPSCRGPRRVPGRLRTVEIHRGGASGCDPWKSAMPYPRSPSPRQAGMTRRSRL